MQQSGGMLLAGQDPATPKFNQIPPAALLPDLYPFRKLHYIHHLLQNLVIIFPNMGPYTGRTILDSIFQILKASAAPVSQDIQRAIAEQTVKLRWIRPLMAGKEFAFPILKKSIVFHAAFLNIVCNSIFLWYNWAKR